MNFFVVEVLIGGLLTGVLYSLVALGFVLIFKASGVFNFAQGAMCLFAALALVRLMEAMPTALAVIAAAVLMLALAFAIERLVLRPLVNQEGLILFMATIGITFFIDGFGQALFGSDVYVLEYLQTAASMEPEDRLAWLPRVRRITADGHSSIIASVTRR